VRAVLLMLAEKKGTRSRVHQQPEMAKKIDSQNRKLDGG
jgi:hypothetical protein